MMVRMLIVAVPVINDRPIVHANEQAALIGMNVVHGANDKITVNTMNDAASASTPATAVHEIKAAPMARGSSATP